MSQTDHSKRRATVDLFARFLRLADDRPAQFPGLPRFTNAADFVAFTIERTAGATTVHQCTLPEIEFTGADTARGIWAMTDVVIRGSAVGADGLPGFRGYGHYHETYRREPRGWCIDTLRLGRLLVVPFDPDEDRRADIRQDQHEHDAAGAVVTDAAFPQAQL